MMIALSRMQGRSHVRDFDAFAELVACTAPAGAAVRILASGHIPNQSITYYGIQVVSGEHEGCAGVVEQEYVKIATSASPRRRERDTAPLKNPVPIDSGGMRVIGLPRGSTVLVDERPTFEPLIRLAPGSHAIGISAPRFNFYSDTIVIRPGEVLEITPELTPIGTARDTHQSK
jgi:hypothetical protein